MTRITPGLGGGIQNETCSKSSTELCYRYRTYTYDDGTYEIRSGSDENDSVTNDMATAYNHVCGGAAAGKRIVYSYHSSTYFKYGNEYSGTGWSGSSWSRDNAENYSYVIDSTYWNGRFAGYAITGGDAGNVSDVTVSGYTRNIRHYYYNTFGDSSYCKKRRVCSVGNSDAKDVYYRPYIIVRER